LPVGEHLRVAREVLPGENYEKNRLQVAVQILGRSTPVELDFSQVEKA
jgi:transcriptional antiterminator NusG